MSEEIVVVDHDLTHTVAEEIDVRSVVNTLSTWVEQGSESVVGIFTSEGVADAIEVAKEIGGDLSKAVKVVAIIKQAASIPDKIFMKKLDKYCKGLVSIPMDKREAYVKRVGKESLNQDSVFVLGMLNRTEELAKISIFLTLFEAKLSERIDDQAYRRMMLLVDRTMYSDILFLRDNITDSLIKITSEEEENLLATGWLIYEGMGIGNAFEDGGQLYKYTETAKKFCDVVFARRAIEG